MSRMQMQRLVLRVVMLFLLIPGCKRPLPEGIFDVIDSENDNASPDICSAKKHKGPFQLNEPVSSISSTTSGSSDSDDDKDSFLDTPPPLLTSYVSTRKVGEASQREWGIVNIIWLQS